MSTEDAHFRLRLPVGLRDKLVALAEENQRSINAEVVARLEMSLAHEGIVKELHKQFNALAMRVSHCELMIESHDMDISNLTRPGRAGNTSAKKRRERKD